ncbi:hypothetical protein D3C80_1387180 [compost metagenome]
MFTSGDVVRLKSGGPMMTVSYASNGECYCVWFKEQEVVGYSFVASTLYSAAEVEQMQDDFESLESF